MAASIRQALVLIGGRASRLRQSGVEITLTKAFLPVLGRPLLFWNLCSLHQAGVRSLVLAGNETKYLYHAQRVLRTLPYHFDDIRLFQDFGLGAHGLPYSARGLLDAEFIFDCGHSISTPEHYRGLAQAKGQDDVVFSAFRVHAKNRRQPVMLRGTNVRLATVGSTGGAALAHPVLADNAYIQTLLNYNFKITDILSHHAKHNRLKFVWSDMPAEFDIVEEMQAATVIYEQYLKNAAIIGR